MNTCLQVGYKVSNFNVAYCIVAKKYIFLLPQYDILLIFRCIRAITHLVICAVRQSTFSDSILITGVTTTETTPECTNLIEFSRVRHQCSNPLYSRVCLCICIGPYSRYIYFIILCYILFLNWYNYLTLLLVEFLPMHNPLEYVLPVSATVFRQFMVFNNICRWQAGFM